MKKYLRNIKSEPLENNTLFEEMVKIRRSEKYNKRVKNSISKRKRANDKKRKIELRNKLLETRSNWLETSLPKSEVWFREKYLKEDINRMFKEDLFKDKFNKPFNQRYIPDVSNKGYKYIIEIDGSWHDRADAQIRDNKKDYYFKKRGYLVLRIKAYNDDSYVSAINELKIHVARMNVEEAKRRSK